MEVPQPDPADNYMTLPHNHGNLSTGLNLFNRGHFFEAHEVLEDVWRSWPRDQPVRQHLQGLVQLAVAFHHASTGNSVGARSVLERALRNLAGADHAFPELNLKRLRADLEVWRRYLEDCESTCTAKKQDRPRPATPPLPKIMRRS